MRLRTRTLAEHGSAQPGSIPGGADAHCRHARRTCCILHASSLHAMRRRVSHALWAEYRHTVDTLGFFNARLETVEHAVPAAKAEAVRRVLQRSAPRRCSKAQRNALHHIRMHFGVRPSATGTAVHRVLCHAMRVRSGRIADRSQRRDAAAHAIEAPQRPF